ncbi:MAG: winged helix-turn-helix domain-containing protein [Alphaproteobacteria bacterium]|nr:winged helix-turn-helix domain-containing protein [Alphaproteobacteria bacterium]
MDGEVDLQARVVVRGGRRERLTAREVELLTYLIARQGQVVSREEVEREVWGMRPGVQSEAATMGVRRLRVKLEPDPKRPAHLHTVRGVGWVFSSPEAPSDPAGRHNLPARVLPLLGREAELDALREALAAPERLVSLIGPPGVGKTHLAQRALQQMLEDHPGLEVWWVEGGEGVSAALARAMGVGASAAPDALRQRPRVIVAVDESERRDALADALAPLWAAPGVRVLLIGRARTRLPGERVVRLEPLSEVSGARLLRRLARAHVPDLEASEDLLRALSARLDGLPLALELAAGRLRLMPPEALLERLERAPQEGELAEVIREAVGELEAPARRALRRCAAFAGSLSLEAVEATCADLSRPPEALLGELVDRSLLRVEGGRYRLLATLGRQLRASPDPEAVARHRAFVLHEGESLVASLTGPEGPASVPHLQALRAELERAFHLAEGADRARLALVLAWLEVSGGDQDARLAWLEAAAPDGLDDALRWRLLQARGRARVACGQSLEGRADLLEASRAGWPTRGRALRGLVFAHLSRGRATEARAQALAALAEPALDPVTRVELLGDLGTLHAMVRAFPEAQAALLEARETARMRGYVLRMGPLWTITADAHCGAGELDEAMTAARRALEAHRACGARLHEATALTVLGRVEYNLGLVEAEAHLKEAARLALELGHVDHAACALDNLAEHLLDQGRFDEADVQGMRAWVLVQRSPEGRWATLTRGNAGLRAWTRGRLGLAALFLRECVAMADRAGQARVGQVFAACLAGVLADQGEAEAAYAAQARPRQPTGDPVDQAHLELCDALVALRLGGDPGPARAALASLRSGPNPLWDRRADVRILGRLVERRLPPA